MTAKKQRSPITTHILDTSSGRPAAGVQVLLERQQKKSWSELARGKTNADGRVEDLLPPGSEAEAGTYRLTFETGGYFKKTFFPSVTITFEIENTREHFHVPLLLSPFGFSTYRGS